MKGFAADRPARGRRLDRLSFWWECLAAIGCWWSFRFIFLHEISKVNRFVMHVSIGLILCIWKHNKTKQIDFSHYIYHVYRLMHCLSLIQSYAVKWYSHMTLLKYSWRNYIPSYWLLREKKPSWQGNSALISPRCLCYEEMLVMPLRCSDSSRRYWKTHVTHMPPFIGSVPTKMPRRHRSISYIMRRAL